MKSSSSPLKKQTASPEQIRLPTTPLRDVERYKQMAALTSEGLMIHLDGIVLDANPTFAHMFNYQNPDELIGKPILDVLPFNSESQQCINAQLQSGSNEIRETEVVKPDGSINTLELFCQKITYHGQSAHLLSIRDITQRKQTEAQLKRQLERLNVLHTIDRAVASVMELPQILQLFVKEIVEEIRVDACDVLLLNPQTQTLNFAAKQGFLTSALEFTHLGLGSGLAGHAAEIRQAIFIPDLGEIKDNPSLTKAIAKENFVAYIGIPLVAKDNLLGVLEIFHRSKFSQEPDWLKFLEILANEAAIAIDNARLLGIAQQSYKETNALYQINKRLIATIDPQELMDDVVELLQTNFGYDYVQIFVADLDSNNFVMRAGSGELGKRLKSEGYHLKPGDGIVGLTADTGKSFFTNRVEDVITFIRPPHLPETKSELAVPIRIGDKFLGLLDIHQEAPKDLTDRDVQLVTAVADQLAIALQKASLYTDLQTALQHEQATRLQLIHNERLTVAGRLLASASHELYNPIQAIQNALFLLQEETGLSSQGKQDLHIILAETDRMATMLQRLRTTYQPVSATDFKPVNMNGIIRDVGALVATHLRHNKILFAFTADESLPPILGLDDQLRQVILNLVMNSVEAMSGGGNLKITTNYLSKSREIKISITDTGPGIDEEILPSIFDAFVTNKERGTGLGLTISNEIIRKHGGRIEAENNPQGGASVHVWLPTSHKTVSTKKTKSKQ